MLGLYLGFLGPWKLLFLLAGLGAVSGWAERYLLRRVTVARLILLAAAVQSALAYEAGLPTMLVALRTGATLALIGKAIEIAWSRVEKQPAAPSTVAPVYFRYISDRWIPMIESRFPVGYRAGQGPSSKAAVMLTPSCGLGGGIERYSNTLEWALGFDGVKCVRLDLQHAGALAHAGMVSRALEAVRAQESPPRLILSHRSLLPLAFLVAGATHVSGMTVICHGADVWGNRPQPRRGLENRLMRRDDVRVVAASTFTAGALAEICRAAILPPGLSQDWFGSVGHCLYCIPHDRHQVSTRNCIPARRLARQGFAGSIDCIEIAGSL